MDLLTYGLLTNKVNTVQDGAITYAKLNAEVSGDIGNLKTAFDGMATATSLDVGKALSPKTVTNGKVVEWQYEVIGGGGGTSDYTELSNKPQINSVTLSGNKSLADLGVHNVPSGGTTGQVLKKSSNTDYAASWSNNTLSGLSDVSAQLVSGLNRLVYNPDTAKWQAMEYNNDKYEFQPDGEGHVLLYASYESIDSTLWYGLPFYIMGSFDGEAYYRFKYLMRKPEFDEWGTVLRDTLYFINEETSTPYNLDIVRFVGEEIEDVGWQYRYQSTAPTAHEVSHTWIGTQVEYTALGTYDPNTIYYIRG